MADPVVPEGPPPASTDASSSGGPPAAASSTAAAPGTSPDASAAQPPDAGAAPSPREEPSILERARAAPITFGLAAINAAVFLVAEQSGSTTQEGTLLAFGAVEPLHVWVGEYWRVATCMFLHIGWIHLLWNTYASIGWSTTLEGALGKRRFLLVYLASGIGGGCASVVSGLLLGPRISAGASGAMFGIIGSTLVLRLRMLPTWRAFWQDPGIRSTLISIGIWTAIGLTALHMDNSAHFGGLVVGGVVTLLLTSRSPRNGWLAFGAAFAALFIGAAHPWWSPRGPSANDVAIYANSYLTGRNPHDPKGTPWPINLARGVRFAEKGCAHGVGLACAVLADQVERTGGAASRGRVDELRRRACELEPRLCVAAPAPAGVEP